MNDENIPFPKLNQINDHGSCELNLKNSAYEDSSKDHLKFGIGIRPVRGTKDIILEEASNFKEIVDIAYQLFSCYNYKPIYLPIFEFLEVFKRSLGDFSDVVSKEMYSFEDRGGDILVLRPEFTAGIMRAVATNGLHHHLPLKLFTYGPLFRYERPQKGRQRQFHQLNIEAIGIKSHKIDAEMILMAQELLNDLGITDNITLNVNSLGCIESRKNYQKSLIEYFSKYKNQLSEDSKARLEKNPLRILDSKDENDQKIAMSAPNLTDFYTDSARTFWDGLQNEMNILGIKYVINKNLVRGLDYYCHTAFEFISTDLGAQSTVLGGGRYDGLSKIMSNIDLPSVGFAAGLERLLLLYKSKTKKIRPCIIVAIGEKNIEDYAFILAKNLRAEGICIVEDYDAKASKKFKIANKINAKIAIIIGEDEIAKNVVNLKNLDTGEQKLVSREQLCATIKEMLNNEF